MTHPTADELTAVGTVKFWVADKGWGGLTSPDVPADIWVHVTAVDAPPGQQELVAGEAVTFRYRPAPQDSWRYAATWVRRLSDGAAGVQ